MLVDACDKNEVQMKEINFVVNLKQAMILQVHKGIIIDMYDHNTPQLFNTLIVATLFCYKAPSIRPLNGWNNINLATSTFSPPWSALMQEGKPKVSTASRNNPRTVQALLLVLHSINMIFLL